MSKPILTNPSYYDIEKGCAVLATEVLRSNTNYDVIVGLSRGGLLPAVILSHLLNKSMVPISYSSTFGQGDNRNHDNVLPMISSKKFVSGSGEAPRPPTILLVDDICDSGNTLKEVSNFYEGMGHVVDTAVLYFKEITHPPHHPKYAWQKIPKDSPWIVFPFEL